MNAQQMLALGGYSNTEQGIKAFYDEYPDEASFHKKMKTGGSSGVAFPQQSTMAKLTSRKKGGSLSGAPYDGQPTAKEFFQQTWIPPGPVGFYEDGGENPSQGMQNPNFNTGYALGGQNTNGIAFPQQVPANYFFAGVPWQNDLGHFAYGGGLPGGSNEMPCLDCGGYMEMGGDNQFGGGVDGAMDYFKKGGHWIQEATKNMRTDKPCTGSNFGGPDCPPGSKRYNLAKTFRAIAKKNYGGVNNTALDPQGNYTGDMKTRFVDALSQNHAVATADDLAKNFDAMAKKASMGNTPIANYGYNMGYNYNGVNPDNLNNYNMGQGMLDNMNSKRKMNNANFFTGTTNFVKERYDPNRNYVNWNLKKTDALPNVNVSKYGGGLYKAAFGVDAFGNPDPNQMGPLSINESNQRTIDNARMLPWNKGSQMMGPGPQGPPRGSEGLYFSPLEVLNQDKILSKPINPNTGQPWVYDGINPRANDDGINPNTGQPWGGIDPGFDRGVTRASAAAKERRAYERERYLDEMIKRRYHEENPEYWTSQNGQTRYDYGDADSWDNLKRSGSGDFGGNWNTRDWNSPNPFFNQMFGDPNMSTRLASVTPEKAFGDFFNRSGVVRNPKKVTYRFNTYVNPQTGKVETKAVPVQGPVQGPTQGPVQGPTAAFPAGFPAVATVQNKPADYNFVDEKLFGPRATQTPDVPKSDKQKQLEQFMQNMYTPQRSGPQGPTQGPTQVSPMPITMSDSQMQNMPITSQPFNMPNQLDIQTMNTPTGVTPNGVNNQSGLVDPSTARKIEQVKQNNQSIPDSEYNFMNEQRPGPIGEQAYGGMPDYSYAYGGYLPPAAFGKNVYGQPDPNFAGPLSPEYEQTMMGAQSANKLNPEDPTGGYELTSTKMKQDMSGTNKFGATMGGLGGLENIALAPQMSALQKDVMDKTKSDSVNLAVRGYRGNTKEIGMGTGSDFGGISDSPQGFTKQGGMIYANGGAYQTGVPLDLTDDEIKAIYAAGGTVSYV